MLTASTSSEGHPIANCRHPTDACANTPKKSAAVSWGTWFARKVRQVGDGGAANAFACVHDDGLLHDGVLESPRAGHVLHGRSSSEDAVAVPGLLRTHAALDGLEHTLLSLGFLPGADEDLRLNFARNHDDAVQVAEDGITGADVDAADPDGAAEIDHRAARP